MFQSMLEYTLVVETVLLTYSAERKFWKFYLLLVTPLQTHF